MKRAVLWTGIASMLLAASVETSMAQSAPAPSGAVTTPAPVTAPAAATPVAPPPGTVTTGTTTPAASEQEMAPIIVTGSAIPTTDTQGANPVVVVDSAMIQQRGYQTAQDILRNIPANGSFSNPGQTSGNFAAGAAYVSLRGLGPQATLVLINGRRVVDYAAPANGQYAFVDVNNIPAAIVDHVEVLTEGTALYGADAVAGVVNIITKKSLGSEDGEIDAYVGNTDSKDAFYQRYTIMGNLASFDKQGFGLVEVDYEHQNSIFAGDRQISQSANQSANGGFDLRSGRTFPGQFSVDGGATEFSILPGTGNVPLTGVTNATDPHVDDGAAALQGFDYNPYTSIIPETERYGVYATYTYKFYDGNITPNLDFDYRHNRTVFKQAPAGWTVGDGIAPETSPRTGEPTFIVPANNPYNQTGVPIDILSYRFTNLGGRIEDVDNDVFRVVPSVDFKLGDGWTLNAGFNFNYSFLDDRNVGYPSAATFQNELNSTSLATAYNPFTSTTTQAPGVLKNLLVTTGNRDSTSLIGTDFRLNGKLFDLPAGPVQLAFGGEYRLERYNQSYSPADLSGDVISSTVQLDTSASRKILSGYTEVDFPITSPSFNAPGFYSLDVYATGRVDKYSTFGSTENPQIRLRWETVPGVVIRGGYSKAFRAPSLPELFAGGNQAVETVFDPVANAFRDVTINGGGNPKLKPETAEVFSAGVAYSPTFIKGLVITGDFFKIRYTNQILQQDPQDLVDSGSGQVLHNPDGTIASITATYANTAFSYIQGIDCGFNYVLGDPNTNYGQVTFGLNGTYYLNYKTDSGAGQSENIGEDSGGVGPYSRYRQDANITWDFHNFEFVVSNDFEAGYTDTSVIQYGLTRSVASYLTFDLQASYTFDKQDIDKWAPGPKDGGFDWRNIVAGTKVTLGVNNVWDVQPPFTANPADTLGYDPSYADPTGRFLYAELSKKF
jgi:iron complex outermembrane receptor protein